MGALFSGPPSQPTPPRPPQGPTIAQVQSANVGRSQADAAGRGLGGASPQFMANLVNDQTGIANTQANQDSALQALIQSLNQGGSV